MIITNGMNSVDVFTEYQIPLIKQIYNNEIKDFLEISHFSVIIISPDKNAYIASPSKEFSANFSEHGLHKYDNTMCPLMYENLDFYTWAEGYIKVRQKEIREVKRMHGLNNGTVFVRRIGDYTLLNCVATKKEDPIMKTLFINNANKILKLGDYYYNEIIHEIENNRENLILPKIEIFKPFLDRDIPCLSSYELKRKEDILKIKNHSPSKEKNIKLIVDNSSV